MERRLQATYAEYLAAQAQSALKLEYLNGEMYALPALTPEQHAIAKRIEGLLDERVVPPGRVFSSNLRIHIQATGLTTYADGVVVYGDPSWANGDDSALTNPSVVVEVTSESTDAYERGEKLKHYQQLPSLRAVMLVAHTERKLTLFTRSSGTPEWKSAQLPDDKSFELPGVSGQLSVRELYEEVPRAALPIIEPQTRYRGTSLRTWLIRLLVVFVLGSASYAAYAVPKARRFSEMKQLCQRVEELACPPDTLSEKGLQWLFARLEFDSPDTYGPLIRDLEAAQRRREESIEIQAADRDARAMEREFKRKDELARKMGIDSHLGDIMRPYRALSGDRDRTPEEDAAAPPVSAQKAAARLESLKELHITMTTELDAAWTCEVLDAVWTSQPYSCKTP
ncbi:MAG: Uma2 family endonuclease [Archangium sp.]|nr:Uma2 family endonuclease [Archangium sp.]